MATELKVDLPHWTAVETEANDAHWLKNISSHSFQVCSTFARITSNSPPPDLRYEMLILDDGSITYNFSLLISNGTAFYASRMGSFDSGDGEYLPAFGELTAMEAGMQSDAYHLQIQQVKQLMQEKGIIINSFSYPQDKEFRCPISDYRYLQLVEVLRYHFSTTLFLAEELGQHRPETAIFESFRELVLSWSLTTANHWRDCSFQRKYERDFYEKANRFYDFARLGVKLYPLRNIHNLTDLPLVTPWNELYCLQLVNKMRRQMITPFFPQYYGNIRIPNTNVHLYQNKAIYDRFRENSKALDKLATLRQRLELEQDDLVIDTIRAAQAQVEAFGQLSGETLAIYMEHVSGWTPSMQLIRLIKFQSTLEYQCITFCILHCMWQLGLNYIMHTDLHLGNVIIESLPLFDNSLGYHYFRMPKPRNISGGDDGPLYDATSTTATSVRIGDAEPRQPTYPNSAYGIRFPIVSVGARVIDFSRAAIFDPEALAGFQPYRSTLLEQRNANIDLMYENALKFLSIRRAVDVKGQEEETIAGTSESIPTLTATQLAAALEDQPLAVFAALEGLDTMMFFGHYIGVLGTRRHEKQQQDPEFFAIPAHQKNFDDYMRLLQTVVGDLVDNARLRLQFLAENRYDMLLSMDSVYVQIIYNRLQLLHADKPMIDCASIPRILAVQKKLGRELKQMWANGWVGPAAQQTTGGNESNVSETVHAVLQNISPADYLESRR